VNGWTGDSEDRRQQLLASSSIFHPPSSILGSRFLVLAGSLYHTRNKRNAGCRSLADKRQRPRHMPGPAEMMLRLAVSQEPASRKMCWENAIVDRSGCDVGCSAGAMRLCWKEERELKCGYNA